MNDPYDEFIDSLGLSFDDTGKIHIGSHGLRKILMQFHKQVRKETLEECIREIKHIEIRTDSGGEIYNEYTELMRDEAINSLKELKPNE